RRRRRRRRVEIRVRCRDISKLQPLQIERVYCHDVSIALSPKKESGVLLLSYNECGSPPGSGEGLIIGHDRPRGSRCVELEEVFSQEAAGALAGEDEDRVPCHE